MKKSSKFIVVLCLLVAIGSLVVAFGPMIKNVTQNNVESSEDLTSDMPGDSDSDSLDNGTADSDVPGGGSSELPDDSGSSDLLDDDSSDSNQLPDDPGSDEVPKPSGYRVCIVATRDSNSSGNLVVTYTNSAGKVISNTYEDPGNFNEDTLEVISLLEITLEDVCSNVLFDFSDFGAIQVFDLDLDSFIYDGSTVTDYSKMGICEVPVSRDTYFMVKGLYF